MFYELIYENGDSSIMSAENDEEALGGIAEAHKRAVEGKRSLSSDPSSPPASRIARVLVYKDHPGEYGADGMVSTKDAAAAVEAHTEGDKVDVNGLVMSLRNLASATISNAEPHESKYQAKEDSELTSDKWQGEVAA